jgi:hypothetical protein
MRTRRFVQRLAGCLNAIRSEIAKWIGVVSRDMMIEGVELERTAQAYFRWVASTPDGTVRTRGPTPATALQRLQAAVATDGEGTAPVAE